MLFSPPTRVLAHQLLRLCASRSMSELASFLPLAKVGEHLDSTLHSVRLAEELGCLMKLALKCLMGA